MTQDLVEASLLFLRRQRLFRKLKDKEGNLPFFCEYIYVKEIEDNWVVFPWEFNKSIKMTNYDSNKLL